MKKILIFFAVIAAGWSVVAPANADPVALTNAEAARLFASLRTTQAGTTALNTRNAALDINALRPLVEAFEAGRNVLAAKAQRISPTDPEREAKILALNAEAEALARAANKVDLTLFSLSDDEIRDAKIPADALAEFLRFLAPKPAKP